MNWKMVCQWIIMAEVIAALFISLYRDVNGRPARKPKGFVGIVFTIVFVVTVFLIYWHAGTFSELF